MNTVYTFWNGLNRFWVAFFFNFTLMLGTFFLLNLVLGVIADSVTRVIESTERQELEELREMLDDFDEDPKHIEMRQVLLKKLEALGGNLDNDDAGNDESVVGSQKEIKQDFIKAINSGSPEILTAGEGDTGLTQVYSDADGKICCKLDLEKIDTEAIDEQGNPISKDKADLYNLGGTEWFSRHTRANIERRASAVKLEIDEALHREDSGAFFKQVLGKNANVGHDTDRDGLGTFEEAKLETPFEVEKSSAGEDQLERDRKARAVLGGLFARSEA